MEVGTKFKKKEGTSKNNEKQKNIQKTARNSEKKSLTYDAKIKIDGPARFSPITNYRICLSFDAVLIRLSYPTFKSVDYHVSACLFASVPAAISRCHQN